ncbi:nucleolar complex protein 14 [Coemansia javaensis]|uniref:Nucleolar complex protein 14 n=1 Tax=Coemansia javaensis TaxID=2761396 RepID=A0A9W8HBK6_9FUNG|nr:nucleolar complex protein 14 [Coemansia javaensis]
MGTQNALKRAGDGKQSALKKLRTALSKAGITGPKAGAKNNSKKGGAKKNDERRARLRGIQSALNPYELQVNRRHLDVLGLKRRDDVVNVAQARQRAAEKRRQTLGRERALRGRRGGITDRRIGENDPTMDPEERMLRRFTAERQKRGGGAAADMYNLEGGGGSDVEEGIVSLTHFGRSLDEIDDFDDNDAAPLSDGDGDDDAGGRIDAAHVAAAHFGGPDDARDGGGPARKKTKAEVMEELIAKSKMHRQERRLERDQDEAARRELDDDFADVRALLFAGSKNAEKEGDHRHHRAPADDDAYDAHVRSLAFEKRARPQDRLRTEEEQARDEMLRLERAERHRVRRMQGLASDSEPEGDDDHDDDSPQYSSTKSAHHHHRRPEADDLGDDFGPAAAAGQQQSDAEARGGLAAFGAALEARIAGRAARADEEEEDEEEDDEEDEEEDEDDEDEDSSGEENVEVDGSDLDESADESTTTATAKGPAPKATNSGAAAAPAPANPSTDTDELPFTFPAPRDYDEWVALVGAYSPEQQVEAARRLRALYHIRLAPQNKDKLGALAVILVEHVAVLSAQQPPVTGAAIDGLVRHIGELAAADPDRFGEHCRQQVIAIHGRIAAGIRGAAGAEGLRASDLVLLRLFVGVFSASDRFHPVVTPLLVAAAQHLAQYTFATLADVAGGLVLVAIAHEAQRLSRRLMPEAVSFVLAVLAAAVARADAPGDWAGPFALDRRQRDAFAALRIAAGDRCSGADDDDDDQQPGIPWAWVAAAKPPPARLSGDEKYRVLRAALALCRRLADCYFALPAFVELFAPALPVLDRIAERLPQFKLHAAPRAVAAEVAALRTHLAAQLAQSRAARQPLRLQSHRPLAIAAVAPKFEANYSLDAHYDPDRARAETTKLRRQLARERRGAVRELRRDTQFLAKQRLDEQLDKDRQYAARMKKAWSVLEADQSEIKKLDRQRIRERKAKV